MAEKLVIKINGDVSNYKAALGEIKSETSDLQSGLSSIAQKSAVAFVALTAAVAGSVAAYRIQEQAEIRTRQTIKATGGAANLTAEEIFKMAGALQEVTTFGDEAIISGQNMLLTFKNIGEDVFPRTTEIMLDMAEAMGTDLKSTAIQLGKALNDPKVGLTALQRVGITFTKQQKDQIKSMQDAGEMAKAQSIILKELESQFGGVARAAAEGTGELIQLKNIIGDLVEDFGKEFLPVILEITKPLKEFFLAFRENKELIKAITTVTKWGIAISGAVAVVASAGGLILGLSATIGALTLAFAPATLAASAFWVAITGPIGIAIAGLGLVAAGILTMYAAMDEGAKDRSLKDINKELEKEIKLLEELAMAHLDAHGNATRLNQDLIDKQNQKVKALDNERVAFIEKENAILDKARKAAAEQLEIDKKLAEQKAEARRAAHEAKIIDNLMLAEKLRTQKLSQDEIDLNIKMTREEADLERQILVDTLKLNQQKLKDQKDIDALKLKEKKLKTIRDNTVKIKQTEEAIERSRMTSMQKFESLVNSQKVKGIQAALGQISTLQNSENKKLVVLGKAAAAANITISTMQGVMAAFALGPIMGPILAPIVAVAGAASLATVAGVKLEKGGVFMGGNVGVDSIQAVVQQGEIVAPTQSYEELIGSVRAKREAEKINEGSGQGSGGNLSLVVSYDSEEASQIVTVRQTEDSALGISQQSFNEAV